MTLEITLGNPRFGDKFDQPPEPAVKTGTALVILRKPHLAQVAVVMELTDSELKHKAIGNLTAPMETKEPGESSLQTRSRILTEEVKHRSAYPLIFSEDPVAWVQTRAGVWVRFEVALADAGTELDPGNAIDVAHPHWMNVNYALHCRRGSEHFIPGILRPSFREGLRSSIKYLSGTMLEPDIYYSTEDIIPASYFNRTQARFPQPSVAAVFY